LKSLKLTFIFILLIFVGSCQKKDEIVHWLKVGSVFPMTGTNSVVGKTAKNAADLFISRINGRGGIKVDGKKYLIRLILMDSESNPKKIPKIMNRLIQKEKIDFIIGPVTTSTSIPAALIAENNKKLMFSIWSTNPETTKGKKYVFRMATDDTFQAKVLSKYLIDTLKGKTVSSLYNEDKKYSIYLKEVFEKEFKSKGGKVISSIGYQGNKNELYYASLKSVAKGQPEYIFLPNFENHVPSQVLALRQIGFKGGFLGGDTWDSISGMDANIMDGNYFSAHFTPRMGTFYSRKFTKRYRREYKELPNDVAGLTYDAFNLLINAIVAKQSFNVDDVINFVLSLKNFEGVTGTKDYFNSNTPKTDMKIMKFEHGDKVFEENIPPLK
jgi:branched-chain amino acid transport system substrate-binding protein